jgi:hypothetical protein
VTGAPFGLQETAYHQAHWAFEGGLFLLAFLLILTGYLTLRGLFTKHANLQSAPKHIQKTPVILMWIAACAPLIGLLSGIKFSYDEGVDIAIGGIYHPDQIAYLVLNDLFFLGCALIVSLTAMLAIALLFLLKPRG